MRVPTRRSEVWRESQQKNDPYMTAEAIERLKRELNDLQKNQRGPAAEEVARTSQMGDLSENAAYQFAKQHLRKINSRILSIQDKLKHAIPIDKSQADGKIRIGSTVTIANQGKEQKFEILGSQESNPFKGRISYSSPLGAALIGHVVDDVVTVESGNKKVEYTIVNVN